MVSRALHDPFLERFFARIPREVAASFTDDQLLAVKRAFAAHGEAGHSIDLRLSFPLLIGRWYLVLILGPERRSRGRRRRDRDAHPLSTLGNAFAALLLLLLLAGAALGALYVVKSALGVDLLPNFSFGIWSGLKEQARMLFR